MIKDTLPTCKYGCTDVSFGIGRREQRVNNWLIWLVQVLADQNFLSDSVHFVLAEESAHWRAYGLPGFL